MQTQKFLFRRSFDTPLSITPHEGRRPTHLDMVSAEEMARAVELSHDKGYRQGLEEGIAQGKDQASKSIEQETQNILKHIYMDMARIATATEGRTTHLTQEVVMLTRNIVQKLFPALEDRLSLNEAHLLIQSVLQHEPPPFLSITAHKELIPLLKAYLTKFHPSISLTFLEDESPHKSHCKVEWHESGVEWAAHTIWEEIDRLLKDFENVLEESK